MIKTIFLIFLKFFKKKKKSLKFLKPLIKNTYIEKIYNRFDYYTELTLNLSTKKPDDIRNLFFDEGYFHSEKIIQEHLRELSDSELSNSVENIHRKGVAFLTPYILEGLKRKNTKNSNFSGDYKGGEILNSSINILNKIKSDKQLGFDLLNLLSIDEHHSLLLSIIYILENKNISQTNKISFSHYFARSIIFDGLTSRRLNHKFKLSQKFIEDYAKKNPNDLQAQLDYCHSLITQPNNVALNRNHSLSFFNGFYSPEKAKKQLEKTKKLKSFTKNLHNIYSKMIKKSLIEPFIFSGFPRSASVYVYTSLCRGLDIWGTGGVQGGAFPNFIISQEGLHFMLKIRGTAHTHLSGSKTNKLELLERYKLKKILIHIRDPRQVLLSWKDWIPKATASDPVQFQHYNLPKGYLKFTDEKQLNWLIENWVPKLNKWLDDWIKISQINKYTNKIYFSKFEDMKKNEKLFFSQILNFLDIDKSIFKMPEKPNFEGDRNFREGNVNTWKKVLNDNQIDQLMSKINCDVLKFFNYNY